MGAFDAAYIANSDPAGYAFFHDDLSREAVDEVNWWSPRATRPLTYALRPGMPVFFRLTRPHHAIVGYGFFADFVVLRADLAWEAFTTANGARSAEHFYERVANLRREDFDPVSPPLLGCHLLREVRYWPRERWLPWNEPQGFRRNTVQGKLERDPALLALLEAAMDADARVAPSDLAPRFEPLAASAREFALRSVPVRSGQGTFRLRLLHAYGERCAITGEHTVPVLDAAHIQPYVAAASNHPQNGMVLTKEFHTLFDRGYVTVEAERDRYIVRVSPRLRADWNNGRRYYAYDGLPLQVTPAHEALRPSAAALRWHQREVFLTR
ncbi:MAG: HNH endonuclease signature motif containing protein [Polyangiales bacterium]